MQTNDSNPFWANRQRFLDFCMDAIQSHSHMGAGGAFFASELAMILQGASFLRGTGADRVMKAYEHMATDILLCLVERGDLCRVSPRTFKVAEAANV